MFSKAKIKRFNEEVGCAPAPTHYNPKISEHTPSVVIEKGSRWVDRKDDSPGPATYLVSDVSPGPGRLHRSDSLKRCSSFNSSTNSSHSDDPGLAESKVHKAIQPNKNDAPPIKAPLRPLSRNGSMKKMSLIKLPSTSGACTDDTDSHSEPAEPLSGLGRSKSARYLRRKSGENTVADLQKRLKFVTEERNHFRQAAWKLEERLKLKMEELDYKIKTDGTQAVSEAQGNRESENRACKDEAAQCNLDELLNKCDVEKDKIKNFLNESHSELNAMKEELSLLQDEKSGLQLRIRDLEAAAENRTSTGVEITKLEDEIEHLTALRDTLEANAAKKDDLIAELQLQVDQIVSEARQHEYAVEQYMQQCDRLENELSVNVEDKKALEHHVHNLVEKYEKLIKEHADAQELNKELIAKKNIEIGLLNDSLSALSNVAKSYEDEIARIASEKSVYISRISQLETTISEVSLVTKEKEVMASVLEDEIVQKDREMTKLEESLIRVETHIRDVVHDRDTLQASLQEKDSCANALKKELDEVKLLLKEKEVLQQFLEKEVHAREEEIASSAMRVMQLEGDLETARSVALDLQQEVEENLNQVFCLKASLNAKDYDIEAKDDVITSLKEEVCQKSCLVEDLQVKISLTDNSALLKEANEKIKQLEGQVASLEENAVALMNEMSEAEAIQKKWLTEAESELEEMSVKYSDALLDHDATRRVLSHTLEELKNQELLLHASEAEIVRVRTELAADNENLESSIHRLSEKCINLEQALALLEEEKTSAIEQLEEKLKVAAADKLSALEELCSVKTTNEGFMSQISQLRVLKLEVKLNELEEEKMKQENDFEVKYNEQIEVVLKLKSDMKKVEENYNDCYNQLQELQMELDERKAELDGLQKEHITLRSSHENIIKNLEEQISCLKIEAEEQSRTLASRDSQMCTLNTTLNTKNEKINKLCKSLEQKQVKLVDLEKRVHELEEEEDKLAREKQEASNQVASLREALDSTKAQLSRLEASLLEKTHAEVMAATQEYENELRSLQDKNLTLEEEVTSWKDKCEHLELMIEPFREQLDAYESEKQALLTCSSAAKEEISKLSEQYASLLGHHNHKQKIHHVIKLKAENTELREDVSKLRIETERQRRVIHRLQDKLGRLSSRERTDDTFTVDKENMPLSTISENTEPLKASTPFSARKKGLMM